MMWHVCHCILCLQPCSNSMLGSQAHTCRRLAAAAVCAPLQDHGVEYKGDDSPLTKADTESNRIICAGLQALTPHVPIISEETKTMPYSIRKVHTWIQAAAVCWRPWLAHPPMLLLHIAPFAQPGLAAGVSGAVWSKTPKCSRMESCRGMCSLLFCRTTNTAG